MKISLLTVAAFFVICCSNVESAQTPCEEAIDNFIERCPELDENLIRDSTKCKAAPYVDCQNWKRCIEEFAQGCDMKDFIGGCKEEETCDPMKCETFELVCTDSPLYFEETGSYDFRAVYNECIDVGKNMDEPVFVGCHDGACLDPVDVEERLCI